MHTYNLADLEKYNEAIEKLVRQSGLDCYEQHFEIVSYEDMLCYEAYVGMPAHYPHWSFGKAYERQKTLYRYQLTGLPYELVINSNPCLAYLMRDNNLVMQILTMAHVYGHNDFFKNNRLFKEQTEAHLSVEMFKLHADRVREYLNTPGIGPEKVEKILDAAHALRFQLFRGPQPTVSREKFEEEKKDVIPDRLKQDLLKFLAERSSLEEWEKDLINMVHEETAYFLPQIETKIMNEGWASFWHYRLLKELELPQGYYLEFIKQHNAVVRPMHGAINPYYVGFKMFQFWYEEKGLDWILEVRRQERDQSFIRRYLNQELCQEMNLFSYEPRSSEYVITEVADEAGWKKVRQIFAQSVGLGSIPLIVPEDVKKGTLVLNHIYDGRELELTYAKETLKYLVDLWGGKVELHTKLDGKNKLIRCNEDKLLSVFSG